VVRRVENKFFVTCAKGIEEVLAGELNRLGIENTEVSSAGVYFTGDWEDCYRANLWLRTAARVVYEIGRFNFKNAEDLYNGAKAIAWSDYFRLNQTFAIFANVSNSEFITHSGFAALKVKDAVADSFRASYGRRPNVDAGDPDIRIFIRINGEECIVNLDTSGESLHKRGYRTEKGKAPMRETLAAALVLMAGYDGSVDFYDFMCGSGTIPIEAALIATNRPPNMNRKLFGFQQLTSYNRRLWTKVRAAAEDKQLNSIKCKITASDFSKRSIEIMKSNARRADVREFIDISVSEFKDTHKKHDSGMIIVNPPYGERLDRGGIEGLSALYELLGDTLKQNYTGHDAYVISGNTELTKCIGLKTSEKSVVYNGPIECRLLKYELYEGSAL